MVDATRQLALSIFTAILEMAGVEIRMPTAMPNQLKTSMIGNR